MGSRDSAQYGARFVAAFISFSLRIRIQHHTSARLNGGDAIFYIGGADNDTGIEIALGGEVATAPP